VQNMPIHMRYWYAFCGLLYKGICQYTYWRGDLVASEVYCMQKTV
jgi:hypothetical protein